MTKKKMTRWLDVSGRKVLTTSTFADGDDDDNDILKGIPELDSLKEIHD
jgi:hypothetical protein